MTVLLLLLALQQGPSEPLWRQVVEALDKSGRGVEIVVPAEERLRAPLLAPGAPPLLSFRFFEGRERHRFGELGLVMDDAGH
jgi:hypothetical protein